MTPQLQKAKCSFLNPSAEHRAQELGGTIFWLQRCLLTKPSLFFPIILEKHRSVLWFAAWLHEGLHWQQWGFSEQALPLGPGLQGTGVHVSCQIREVIRWQSMCDDHWLICLALIIFAVWYLLLLANKLCTQTEQTKPFKIKIYVYLHNKLKKSGLNFLEKVFSGKIFTWTDTWYVGGRQK